MEKLIFVKGNKQIRVAKTEKERYLGMGFSLISEDGEVIKEGSKTNVEFEKECNRLKAENEKLVQKLVSANEEIEALKTATKEVVVDAAKDEEIAELKKQATSNEQTIKELKDELDAVNKSLQDALKKASEPKTGKPNTKPDEGKAD